ncbi:Type II secretion system (T2SS), protein G [Myxococcus fulvus]|uniref:Type II secretion system (T2SS), protein G n=1 Tax=Myxococcus fulvus TaxID=33 RepID=A0A511SXC7_MYXFU|nr:type II secretion system protein GspG [Myxococcus fulvus]GEN05963.1 type II secretion system protein GspG [Myxococcus fulvus]SET62338.1 Type II secretion system (T2SS), protein G [Myxococcus fulvus]
MNDTNASPPNPAPRQRPRKVWPWVLALSLLSCCGFNVFAVVAPSYKAAQLDRAQLDLKNLRRVLVHYRSKTGRYPTREEGLQALVASGLINGSVPLDPWTRPYGYSVEGDSVELWSLGPDGRRGCECDDLVEGYPETRRPPCTAPVHAR